MISKENKKGINASANFGIEIHTQTEMSIEMDLCLDLLQFQILCSQNFLLIFVSLGRSLEEQVLVEIADL